eukprot:4839311-Amphidinium_carterae.1
MACTEDLACHVQKLRASRWQVVESRSALENSNALNRLTISRQCTSTASKAGRVTENAVYS